MKLQIKNSLILTVNPQNEVLENADIAIENGCLLAVGKVPENFEADKVIDATDQIAMPGLVNAHMHIPMSLFRNYADDLPFWPWLLEKIKPAEDHLSAEHVYWGAKLGILELIQSGVTCFSDMYFYMGEVAKVVEESGIKACLSGVLLEVSDLGPTFMKAAVDFHDSWHGKAGGRIKVLDTRKTTPGFRELEKYAVKTGGGYNHRMNLEEMAMLKENHLIFFDSIEEAVKKIREKSKNVKIEVEVKNLEEFKEVLNLDVDRIMLDNFTLDDIKKAVKINGGKRELEISGGVNESNIEEYSLSGADYVSSGALTHSFTNSDFSLLIKK